MNEGAAYSQDDRNLDHHRLLQCTRGSRAVSFVAACSTFATDARDSRRRQRIDGRKRGRGGARDEPYSMSTDDVDSCAAIRARGRRIVFTPDVEIVHLRGRSAASAPRATHAAYRRSQLAFYEKHHPRWAPLLRLYLRLRGE